MIPSIYFTAKKYVSGLLKSGRFAVHTKEKEIYFGVTDKDTVKILHSGSEDINAKTLDNKEIDEFLVKDEKITSKFTDDIANKSFTCVSYDYNLSGSDALTADRAHVGQRLDIDSSATGGDTSDEHRIYGYYTTIDVSGDSDLIYGNYTSSRAFQVDGTVSTIIGSYNMAQADNLGGNIGNSFACYNASYEENEGLVSNLYGTYTRTLKQSTSTSNTSKHIATHSEVQIDEGAGDISIAYAHRAIINNNRTTDAETAIGISYLYYGEYQGAIPDDAYGIYINSDVKHLLNGEVKVKGTWDKPFILNSNSYLWDDGTNLYGKVGTAPTSATDGTIIL